MRLKSRVRGADRASLQNLRADPYRQKTAPATRSPHKENRQKRDPIPRKDRDSPLQRAKRPPQDLKASENNQTRRKLDRPHQSPESHGAHLQSVGDFCPMLDVDNSSRPADRIFAPRGKSPV